MFDTSNAKKVTGKERVFYYPEINAFRILGVHKEIPDGGIEVDPQYHIEIKNEANMGQKEIVPDEKGYPVLRDIVIPDEALARRARDLRNSKLKSTDYTQLPDIPEHMRRKYAHYRQQLRDITIQKGFPRDIIWPREPK